MTDVRKKTGDEKGLPPKIDGIFTEGDIIELLMFLRSHTISQTDEIEIS